MSNLTEIQATFVFSTCPDVFWYNPAKVPKTSGLKTTQTVQFIRLFLLNIADYHQFNQRVATLGLAYSHQTKYLQENKEKNNLTFVEIVSRAMTAFKYSKKVQESLSSDSE